MPRSRTMRVLIIIGVVLALTVVAGVALVATVIRKPLPDHSGTLTLPGLDGEVTVYRDARAVPTIVATTAHDLFAAQGFVHAQDRFFEMDYRRHVTAGRLSELVGENEDALAADKAIRTMGWRDVAARELHELADTTQAYLQAYADGVNAYLATRSPDSLGVEYTVLGLKLDLADPEPWDAVDSLAWLKAMAWDLRSNYDEELDRGLAYAALRDVDAVDELFPAYPTDHEPIVGPVPETPAQADAAAQVTTAPTLSPELTDALQQVSAALDAVPHLLGDGEGIGSNSWVVSGEHTASGAPMLANDPHLSISAPGIWSQMGLYCAKVTAQCPFEVSGFTFSGFPGVIIGRNPDLAWGLTNLGPDVTDFFLERVDDAAETFLRDGAQIPLITRTEVIKVNGGDPVTIEVRSTTHGPLVSEALDVRGLAGAPTRQGTRAGTEVALDWTALTPGKTADAVFLLDTAKDAADVAAAAVLFEVPAQNIVYATADGHIGYQAPGRVPLRAAVPDGPVPADGTWPRPGWDSRYDWQGYVDPSQMPAEQDPASGYIVAANQAVTAPDAGPFLTTDWDYGFRSDRIRTLLDERIASGEPLTVEAMGELQNDAWNPFAAALVPVLLRVGRPDAFTQEAVDLLRDWDFQQTGDSSAAAYFAAVWATVLSLTFQDDLPEDLWPDGGGRWLEVVIELLDDPTNPFWDDRRTVTVVESRDEILVRAMEAARIRLTVELGKDATQWQWGRLHRAAPEHPVLGGDSVPGVIRRLVNPSPLGVDGGSSIVNATAWDAASGSFAVTAAPSMRMVVDMGAPDAGTWVTMTGTSGHPGSVHYTDQFAAWAAGDTYPWPFTLGAVQDAAVRELTLVPSPG